ncbi:low-specificity L-threonine aldolase [Gudongella oleilytica]|uniref:low-specificity L-threonine aldolase n=1 Tax=Gudongella oleilytica TaxID=1582259 RepID=UPI000FF8A2CC|nr:low-specificity L-threonine aldolase [Gudongella oleilytica]
MRYIDLRSDTVTMPTDEMRKAMAAAPVGDDVYEDDPTIKRLEELAARMAGKEAALFVPSGTMGNQLAIMSHTSYGDEIIVGANSHIVVHEVGAAARLSGVSYAIVDNPDDRIYAKDIIRKIRTDDIHHPRTGLVCLENALANGTVVPLNIMKEVYETAKANGLPVHTDGARLFNAATALGVDASEVARYTDSIMFCLSKGLCAPVGSMLAGSGEFINRARKHRKLLGGGMRQAGILAAAGIIALEEMTKRLSSDHENAKYMMERLMEIPEISLKPENVQIDMVYFGIKKEDFDAADFTEYLLTNGVKINNDWPLEFRYVTHNDILRDDIDKVIGLMKDYFAK